MDKHSEHRNTADEADKSNPFISAFSIGDEDHISEFNLSEKTTYLQSLIGVSLEGATPSQEEIVEAATKKAYEAYLEDGDSDRIPDLADFIAAIREQPGDEAILLADRLKIYLESPVKEKSRKKSWVIGIVTLAIVAVVVIVFFVAMQKTLSNQSESQSTVSNTVEMHDESQASKVVLAVKGEAPGTEISKLELKIYDSAKPDEAIEEVSMTIGEEVDLEDLEEGSYRIEVVKYPILDDGSTYKVSDEGSLAFKVDGSGKKLSVEIELVHIPIEEMDSEELEAAAQALESSGNTEAAGHAREATGGSSSGGAGSSSEGNSGGGSSGNPGSSGSVSPPPTPTIHEPLYRNHTYEKGILGSMCSVCRIDITNNSGSHMKEHALAGEAASVLTDAVVGRETVEESVLVCGGCTGSH